MSARRRDILKRAVEELRNESLIGVLREDVVRVSKSLSPHLYDGSFAKNLAKIDLFSDQQAQEAADVQREEHELETERVLLHYVNEEPS